MSAIKRFFEKRKLNVKFKKAGAGHRLDQCTATTSPRHPPSSASLPACSGRQNSRPGPADTEAAQKAADAALSRLTAKQSKGDGSVRARMRTEIEAEKRRQAEAEAAGQAARAGPKEVMLDGSSMLPAVLYCCPEIGPEVLSKDEMEAHIFEFLLNSLADDPEMTSALMIHTLNKNPEKVKVCIETLMKYLDNIISHPEDEKFWKIRVGNKAFQERVAALKGTEEFLQAVGFVLRSLPHEDHQEDFLVLSEEMASDTERLKNIKDVLIAAEPIKPQLHRDVKVFHPSSKAGKFEVPEEFYSVSPAELKKEQQRREEAVEKLGMLRTKAMRERDEIRELRKYRFTLIRVRFPDGVLLQGVFKAHEKLAALRQFVGEQLCNWLPFILSTSTGQKLTEDGCTFAELSLAPAAVVNFAWDPEVVDVKTAQKGSYLMPEVMRLIQSL